MHLTDVITLSILNLVAYFFIAISGLPTALYKTSANIISAQRNMWDISLVAFLPILGLILIPLEIKMLKGSKKENLKTVFISHIISTILLLIVILLIYKLVFSNATSIDKSIYSNIETIT